MLNILHVSTHANGGAASACLRLDKALKNLGHISSIYTSKSKLNAYIDAAIGHLTNDHNPDFHSYNLFPTFHSNKINALNPDIVHIHWVGAGFMTPQDIARIKAPIVWTLHDFWPLSGGEHLPTDFNRFKNGYNTANRSPSETGYDLNKLVWSIKKNSWITQKITYIAPSSWVLDKAKSAKLLMNSIIKYIRNGLEISKVKFEKKNNDLNILFVADNYLFDMNKGLDSLYDSLKLLVIKFHLKPSLTIIGGILPTDHPLNNLNLKIESFPTIHDQKILSKHFQAATLTLVPSRMETLSYVTMESMANGTPVVAFRVGGIPDLINHQVNGYLANPYDVEDFANGVNSILTSPKLRVKYSKESIRAIKDSFEITKIAREHVSLYESLL